MAAARSDFSTLKMETIRSSETSVYTGSARRHIPEDGILLKLIVASRKKFPAFYGTQMLITVFTKAVPSSPSLEPEESSPHPPIQFL
jgi:hypothetical protein